MSICSGHYLQTVVPFHIEESVFNYPKGPDMHLTEASSFATADNRDQLYAEWRRYWNASKSILIEKSPRHMLMTRLLQYWFGADKSHFVAMLRHPLGTLRQYWQKGDHFGDCGEAPIGGWLLSNERMLEDLKHIRHKALLRYESLAAGRTAGEICHTHTCDLLNHSINEFIDADQFRAALKRLGLSCDIDIAVGSKRRRNFQGDREHPVFDPMLAYRWLPSYMSVADRMPSVCNRVADMYEARVNAFGYSLRNLRQLQTTDMIRPFLIDADSLYA